MGLTKFNGRHFVYDGEKLFKQYCSWGAASSHKRLRRWATEQGMVTPGKAKPSQMGAFWAMWRWAIRNPEEAYPHYKEWWYESDAMKKTPTFEEFMADLKKHAQNRSTVSNSEYMKFIEKYSL